MFKLHVCNYWTHRKHKIFNWTKYGTIIEKSTPSCSTYHIFPNFVLDTFFYSSLYCFSCSPPVICPLITFWGLNCHPNNTLLSGSGANELASTQIKPRCVFMQVKICSQLVSVGRVMQEDIAILSPYNAQVAQIRERLSDDSQLKRITVTTITKSQGNTLKSFPLFRSLYFLLLLLFPLLDNANDSC